MANTQVETSVVSLWSSGKVVNYNILQTKLLFIVTGLYCSWLHLLEKRKPEVAFNEKQFQTLKSKSKAVENGMHCAVNMLRLFAKLKLLVTY